MREKQRELERKVAGQDRGRTEEQEVGGRTEDRKRQRVAEEGEREKQKSITERMNGRREK